jgi:hypothetical protein
MTAAWTPSDLVPGVWVALLAGLLLAALRRWFDPLPGRVAALFAVLLALLLGPTLFGGGILLPLDNLRGMVPFRELEPPPRAGWPLQGDLVHQITPWRVEVRRALTRGEWPLWNRHAGGGMPLLGDPQSQALAPLTLLALPFDATVAAGVIAALRILAALVFSFLFLRRQGLGEPAALVGGLAYGLGGFLLLWLGWPIANAAALLPAALYAIARLDEAGGRRDHLLLAGCAAGLWLGGHPEVTLYALAACAGFALVRLRSGADRLRRLRRCATAFVLAAGLAAPVLLTARDYLPTTQRAAVVGQVLGSQPLREVLAELTGPGALAAWGRRAVERLLPLVAPRAFGDQTHYWGAGNLIEDASGFAGTATLLAALLALGARRGRRAQESFFAGLLLVSLALLAQPPGLAKLLFRIPVAGFAATHGHHRILLLAGLAIAYLAACEVDRLAHGEGRGRAVLVAVAAALAAVLFWAYLGHAPDDAALLRSFRLGWLTLQLAILTAAAGLALPRPARRARSTPSILCALVALELLVAHWPANPAMPKRLAYPLVPAIAYLQERAEEGRVVGHLEAFLANLPAVYGLDDVRIDNPALPRAYAQAVESLDRRHVTPRFHRPLAPLYDLLGTRFVVTRPGTPLRLPRVYADDAAWIYERPSALPRLFLPAGAVAAGAEPWWRWVLARPDFAQLARVEALPASRRESSSWRARRPAGSRVELLSVSPARIAARVRLVERRLLASSFFQDGHWRLLRDREPHPSLLANGPFLAAWLAPGEGRLDWLYRPRGLLWGLLAAAAALAAGAARWVPPPRAAPG